MSSVARLSDAERRDRLRLIRTENVGPITFNALLQRFGTASAALAALPDFARRGGRAKVPRICPVAEAEAELDLLARLDARLIARGEPEYPPALAAIEDAPPLLCARGRAELLARKAVAIVGARNASANGVRFARQLAADLGAAGLLVVSGFARGIDTGAHQGSLATGTAGVMAGGVDIIYPPENDGLYRDLLAKGVAVSEMPPGLVPQARHFPRRNRIVSGMSLAVVIVEASLKSGSLITARIAGEQGRDVFAVPGSPLDPRARGTNNLIREGAILTESAADVLAALGQALPPPAGGTLPPAESAGIPSEGELLTARERVTAKLGPTPVAVDEIVRQCQLPAAVVLTILLELELAGRLTRHPGNQVSL